MTTEQNALPSQPVAMGTTNTTRQSLVAVTAPCACDRDITAAELAASYGFRATDSRVTRFLKPINDMFSRYGITRCLGKAHLLAQMGHESARLQLLEEQGISAEKETASYCGYKGRGLIQLTFKDAYSAYGSYCGEDFLDANKTRLAEPKWATDSARWFWTTYKGINLNDFALKNDLIFTTSVVNGAFNGWDDRKNLLGMAHKALLVDACPNESICWDVVNFRLKNSECIKRELSSFAWGYWFDPTSPSSRVLHVTRDRTNAVDGYENFLTF